MGRDDLKKIVYEDNNITKVLKGFITKEDEFTYSVESQYGETVVIGKRAIIKIYSAKGDF